jgi:L-fuconolactonase
MQIDAHQHFWKYNEDRDAWITDDMSLIQRNFLPEDLRPLLPRNQIDGTVVVQSDQSKDENIFQLANSLQHDFIKGVVGWVDLQAEDLTDQLSYYQEFKKMKGFRHVLQGEPQRDFMLRSGFMRGIGMLKDFGYTYDILIYPDQLPFAVDFVKAFPDQPFVLDHLAKPYIRDGKLNEWKSDIKQLAGFENVSCKISGMVTEAKWGEWKKLDFKPYLDAVVEFFGTNRLMFGSDWPVCLVAASSYEDVIDIVRDYFSTFSENDRELVFGKNAISFYNL